MPVHGHTQREAHDDPLPAGVVPVAMVDKAIKRIREILARKGTSALQPVGQRLLDLFYNGDAAAYRRTRSSKLVTLRVFEERARAHGLVLRRGFVSNAIGVAALAKQLGPGSAFRKLSPSHQVELLGAPSVQAAGYLAGEALGGKLSVRQLRDQVRWTRGKNAKPRRGRQPTPKVLLALGSCMRALKDEPTRRAAARRSAVKALSEAELQEAMKRVAQIAALLAELARTLGEVTAQRAGRPSNPR